MNWIQNAIFEEDMMMFTPSSRFIFTLIVNLQSKMDSLDEHIRRIHKDVVKKTFSKEAFEMVMKSEDYTEWLKKKQVKKNRAEKKVTVSQMQKTNPILVEKLNSKNENAYEVVKTNDDIVEMKRY